MWRRRFSLKDDYSYSPVIMSLWFSHTSSASDALSALCGIISLNDPHTSGRSPGPFAMKSSSDAIMWIDSLVLLRTFFQPLPPESPFSPLLLIMRHFPIKVLHLHFYWKLLTIDNGSYMGHVREGVGPSHSEL